MDNYRTFAGVGRTDAGNRSAENENGRVKSRPWRNPKEVLSYKRLLSPDIRCRVKSNFNGLLFDKPVVSPETLRVAIAGIHEFDVMPDHANYAEIRIFGRRNALKT